MSDLRAPIVEPEIAVRLGHDLRPEQGPYTAESIIGAVEAMYPAIEVVDCRYASGWPIPIGPTIADNGVHAVFVAGAAVSNWRRVDRPAVRMHATVNGQVVTEGSASNVVGDPLNVLVWLANALGKRGKTLRRGEIVTTGNTANAPIFARAGDSVAVILEGIGEVKLRFD